MMRCIAPDTVTEGSLLAYVESPATAPAALQTHLKSCQHCQSEVKQLTLLSAFFSPISRLDCPLPSALLAYAAHLSPPEARAQVEKHLTTCAHCPPELKVMQNDTGLETDALGAPFLQLWTQLVHEGRRVIEAVLRPSQLPAPAPRATSGSGDVQPQTWAYALPDRTLELTLHPPSALDPQTRLEGQLSPWPPDANPPDATREDIPHALARLHVPDAPLLEAEIDDLGHFSLSQPSARVLAIESLRNAPLELRWNGVSVLVSSLLG